MQVSSSHFAVVGITVRREEVCLIPVLSLLLAEAKLQRPLFVLPRNGPFPLQASQLPRAQQEISTQALPPSSRGSLPVTPCVLNQDPERGDTYGVLDNYVNRKIKR